MNGFHTQGAVPLSSPAHIPRKFETRLLQEVHARKWVLLLGPRQHGKTTGLVRLAHQLRDDGFLTVMVDLQRLPPCASYPQLLGYFAAQIRENLNSSVPAPKANDQGDIAAWLEAAFPPDAKPVVVIIDEAGSIENSDFRNAFYGQIRHLNTARAGALAGAFPTRVTFVFAGTFRPETLVQACNSPFNVCQSIYTDDVTCEQAMAMAEKVNPEYGAYVAKAHATLNGQPYLLQTVFHETSFRTETTLELAFTETLQNMQQLASAHLEGIFSRVIGSPSLTEKVSKMVCDGDTDISPADSDCTYLQVLGLAKRQGNKLLFRNTLYASVAKISHQLSVTAGQKTGPSAIFGVPKSDFDLIKNDHLRAICCSTYNGAVKAHSNGSYRLALTGFGSAMEALLLDWVMGSTDADILKAVAAAEVDPDPGKRPNFGKILVKPGPEKWTLFNLINVARKVKVGAGSPEPSHALRDWRNLVHPGVALKDYMDEALLEPDSMVAASMFMTLLRDIRLCKGTPVVI
jgi:hypothetical protein